MTRQRTIACARTLSQTITGYLGTEDVRPHGAPTGDVSLLNPGHASAQSDFAAGCRQSHTRRRHRRDLGEARQRWIGLLVVAGLGLVGRATHDASAADDTAAVQVAAKESTAAEKAPMLVGSWVPDETHDIQFDQLPRIRSQHAVISDVRPIDGVNQHNYLAFHNGKYWAMWSDGPGVEDRVGQRVKFATSDDGLRWSNSRYLTPVPPRSGKDSPYYGQRDRRGFRWISRGFWQRHNDILALASLDEAAGFSGRTWHSMPFGSTPPTKRGKT